MIADPSAVQAWVLHLAFTGVFSVDLDRPLSTESLVAPSPEFVGDVPLEVAS